MHYYNDAEEPQAQGLTGTLLAYFAIMLVIMFIFSFAIIVYALHKRNAMRAINETIRSQIFGNLVGADGSLLIIGVLSPRLYIKTRTLGVSTNSSLCSKIVTLQLLLFVLIHSP